MKYSLLVLVSCILTLVSSVPAQQDVVDQNSRFVMTLNDALISNLKSLGTLPSNLPAQAVGKIAAVHMQFSGASTEPATPVSAEVSVVGNACRISLTDDLIEMARQKPIRVDLPDDSQFASVFLDYAQSSSSSSSPNLDWAARHKIWLPATNQWIEQPSRCSTLLSSPAETKQWLAFWNFPIR